MLDYHRVFLDFPMKKMALRQPPAGSSGPRPALVLSDPDDEDYAVEVICEASDPWGSSHGKGETSMGKPWKFPAKIFGGYTFGNFKGKSHRRNGA